MAKYGSTLLSVSVIQLNQNSDTALTISKYRATQK